MEFNRNLDIFILKNPFEITSGKWRPFCLGLNVLSVKLWVLKLCQNGPGDYREFKINDDQPSVSAIGQMVGFWWAGVRNEQSIPIKEVISYRNITECWEL